MSTASSTIDRIRSSLASVDQFVVPPGLCAHHKPSSDNAKASSSTTLVADYKNERDRYINSQVLRAYLESVTDNKIPDYDPDERQRLEERKQDLLQQVTAALDSYAKTSVEMQAKYECLLQKRQDLESTLNDMSERGVWESVEEQENVAPVDEEEMAEEQRRLDSLQLTLAQRKVDLQTSQQKHDQVRKELQIKQKVMRDEQPNRELSNETLVALEEQNKVLLAPFNKLKSERNLLRALLDVHQALLGIKLLGVATAPEGVSADLVVTIQAQGKHDIQIGLVQVPAQNRVNLRPSFARFVTDTIVRGPRLQFHHGNPVFQKEIPALDDLVRLSQNIPDLAGAMRFLIAETMDRINTTHALVKEMSVLEEEMARDAGQSSDYKFYTADSQYGDTEHHVTFEFNGMVVLLRLTTDCPKLSGSVFVEEILAKAESGWKQSDLDDALKRVNESQFKSPVEIVRAIKDEVSKLSKTDNREADLDVETEKDDKAEDMVGTPDE